MKPNEMTMILGRRATLYRRRCVKVEVGEELASRVETGVISGVGVAEELASEVEMGVISGVGQGPSYLSLPFRKYQPVKFATQTIGSGFSSRKLR
jgi:hypothetical protein